MNPLVIVAIVAAVSGLMVVVGYVFITLLYGYKCDSCGERSHDWTVASPSCNRCPNCGHLQDFYTPSGD